ncbi:hypothetical protein ACFL27_11910 [candidate division CSSED10-310 bacterium]|uniref:Photosynthesis system II assembly factor Ycf48/Hcf136-like domain-containing protein n=1 Tax=candidate division CSSED10-310 bacterium TaxID=2855610 RepID=A0ABV6YXH8_UNCC1
MDLILPIYGDTPGDVDLGFLLKSGLWGGIFGVLISFIFLLVMQKIARIFPDNISPLKVPFLFFIVAQLSIPCFFSCGAAGWMFIKSKAMGIQGSWWRTLGGAVMGILIAFLFWGSSKILGITAMIILPLILGARFGLGIFAPIWPLKKIMIGVGLAIMISVTIFILKQNPAPISNISAAAITCISKDLQGSLWMANGGGDIFYKSTSTDLITRVPFQVSNEVIIGIYALNENHFFIINQSHGFIEFSAQSPQRFLSERKVNTMVVFRKHLVVGTDHGCFIKSLDSEKWQMLTNFDDDQPENLYPQVRDLMVVEQTLVAAFFECGLYCLTSLDSGWQKTTFPDQMPYLISPLSTERGEIFVATPDRIYQGNLHHNKWQIISAGLPDHLLLQSLTVTSGGDVFIAGAQELYSRKKGQNDWLTVSTFNNSIYGMAVSDGDSLYLATGKGLLVSDNGKDWIPQIIPPRAAVR